MEKGLTQKQIDDWYIDVERLGLKFPGAAISEATGYSPGNVSSFLNRKLPPSLNFLNKFYEKFPKSYNNVPREMENAPQNDFKTDSDGHSKTNEVIANLSESSKAHGLADQDRAAAELLREQNHSKIIDYITRQSETVSRAAQSGSEQLEIPEAFQSKLVSVLEFLAEVAAGKRYKSEAEASAILSKLVYGGQAAKKGKGIRRD